MGRAAVGRAAVPQWDTLSWDTLSWDRCGMRDAGLYRCRPQVPVLCMLTMQVPALCAVCETPLMHWAIFALSLRYLEIARAIRRIATEIAI